MLFKHIKAPYTITTPVHLALSITETISTPLEYAAPAAKFVHRLLNHSHQQSLPSQAHLLLGEEMGLRSSVLPRNKSVTGDEDIKVI